MKVLVYLGLDKGRCLNEYIPLYDKIIGIEARPWNARMLQERYAQFDHVEIIEGAVYDTTEEYMNFYVMGNPTIPSHTGQSSSLGKIRDDSQYNTCQPDSQTTNPDNKMTVKEVIRVKTLNLMNILKERNIEHIHTYVSDIEGADLTVLKTIEPFIKNKKIDYLQMETEEDWIGEQVHDDLNTNKQAAIISYLKDYVIFKLQQGNYGPQIGKKGFEGRYVHRDVYFKLPHLPDIHHLHE
jgi:FkbM family methyltransferase